MFVIRRKEKFPRKMWSEQLSCLSSGCRWFEFDKKLSRLKEVMLGHDNSSWNSRIGVLFGSLLEWFIDFVQECWKKNIRVFIHVPSLYLLIRTLLFFFFDTVLYYKTLLFSFLSELRLENIIILVGEFADNQHSLQCFYLNVWVTEALSMT